MRGPYYWLIGSLMKPEDDFCQRLRKSCSAVFFIPGSLFTFSYCIKSLIDGFSGGQAPIVEFIGRLTITLTLWGQYAVLRKTKHVGGVQVGLLPWASQICNLTLLLNRPEYDQNSIVFVLALLSVLLQIPKVAIFLVFSGIIALVQHWNHSHFHDAPGSMLLLPQGYHNGGPNTFQVTPIDLFIFATLTALLLAAVIYNFILQVQESERLGAAQKAANEMTLKILRCQRRYDTAGISDILVESREEDVVDPKLIGLYETMNSNLQSYRPFLPNYLFQEEEEEEGEAALNAPRVPLGGRPEVEGADLIDLISNAESSNISYTDVEQMSPSGSRSVTDGDTATAISECSQGNDRNQLTPSVVNPIDPVTGRRGMSTVHFSHGPRAVSGPMDEQHAQSTHFTAYISMAVVDIQVDRLLATLKSGSGAQASPQPTQILHQDKAPTVKTLVNIIYSVANETKASVHSLVGDTVQLSWNATHTISLPETKGALFLARLRKLFAARGGPKKPGQTETLSPTQAGIAGAVCSGEATVHSIISTTHQRSLVIDAPWLPALTGCFDLAKRHGAMLMDERTARGANLSVDGVVVEKIFYQNLPFCSEAEDEEEATSMRSFSGTLQQGRAPSSHHFLFHSPNREIPPEQNACPLLPVPDRAAGTTSQPTPTNRIDRSVSGGSLGGGGSSSQNASIVFQILGEKTRQDNLEWMYQLDRSEVNPSGGVGSATETSNQQPGGGVAQLQKDVVEAFADGRMADAVRTLDYFETRNAPLRLTSPTSASDDTTKTSFASTAMKSPPPTQKFGDQNIMGICLPTFRAAIILAVRSRAPRATTGRTSSQPPEVVSVGSGAAK